MKNTHIKWSALLSLLISGCLVIDPELAAPYLEQGQQSNIDFGGANNIQTLSISTSDGLMPATWSTTLTITDPLGDSSHVDAASDLRSLALAQTSEHVALRLGVDSSARINQIPFGGSAYPFQSGYYFSFGVHGNTYCGDADYLTEIQISISNPSDQFLVMMSNGQSQSINLDFELHEDFIEILFDKSLLPVRTQSLSLWGASASYTTTTSGSGFYDEFDVICTAVDFGLVNSATQQLNTVEFEPDGMVTAVWDSANLRYTDGSDSGVVSAADLGQMSLAINDRYFGARLSTWAGTPIDLRHTNTERSGYALDLVFYDDVSCTNEIMHGALQAEQDLYGVTYREFESDFAYSFETNWDKSGDQIELLMQRQLIPVNARAVFVSGHSYYENSSTGRHSLDGINSDCVRLPNQQQTVQLINRGTGTTDSNDWQLPMPDNGYEFVSANYLADGTDSYISPQADIRNLGFGLSHDAGIHNWYFNLSLSGAAADLDHSPSTGLSGYSVVVYYYSDTSCQAPVGHLYADWGYDDFMDDIGTTDSDEMFWNGWQYGRSVLDYSDSMSYSPTFATHDLQNVSVGDKSNIEFELRLTPSVTTRSVHVGYGTYNTVDHWFDGNIEWLEGPCMLLP